ncbi:DoxX family protein [Streptomyces sp. ST2-7A]|uniref:DoxX family protein n=1 Tax=Streptomyces sp. ST2-7A TaxID=2907214 RepID=UPI001F30134B|nr:DoxX family membrane protein [Streptomyces sp. ST2-7A]MCE7080221.1 DoxX family membrane protein [Streptomyces sp. ST2-7A]
MIVNHASFRVRLGTPAPVGVESPPHLAVETAPIGVPFAGEGTLLGASSAGRGALIRPGGRRPVIRVGDTGAAAAAAAGLWQSALRRQVVTAPAGVPVTVPAGPAGPGEEPGTATTTLLPRVTRVGTAVIGPRSAPISETVVLPRLPAVPRRRRATGPGGPSDGFRPSDDDIRTDGTAADDLEPLVGPSRHDPPEHDRDGARSGTRPGGDGRHAYYPGRGMNLGIVLLPLRLLIGFIMISGGMGKLTDPVYFDGGEGGSMVAWLSSLQPWGPAGPLHEWALAHPVGAGLTVAFTQIVVGVLTIAGLWQRLAAALGALLSIALLITVSWHSGPTDTPDIILLAAWSPLIIAGAPVYSLDARLAGEAWRTLGPHVPLRELRGRVLRRGALIACLLLGVTLLFGSIMGSAVRSSEFSTVPRPGEAPRNHLPGAPLPPGLDGGEPGTPDMDEEVGPVGSAEAVTDGPAGSDADPGSAADISRPATGSGESPNGAGEAAPAEGVPGGDQTVRVPPQQSGPAVPEQGREGGAPAPAPAPVDGGGAGGAGGEEPPAESGSPSTPPAEGGDRSSLGTLGGLLG